MPEERFIEGGSPKIEPVDPGAHIDRALGEMRAGVISESDRRGLEVAGGLFDVGERVPGRREPEEEEPEVGTKGIADEEMSKGRYEAKVTALKLAAGVTTTALFCGALYLLTGKLVREPIAKEWRIEDYSAKMGWFFNTNSPDFKGGWQILNMVRGGKIPAVDYDNRETWGYKHLPGGVFEGGNSFGETARILVKWTDFMSSPSGRATIIEMVRKSNLEESGALKFDQVMGREEERLGHSLSWEEITRVLRTDFGFEQRYLNILTELRREYYTGDGNVSRSLEETRAIGLQEKILLDEQQLERAGELLAVTGMDKEVDPATALEIAALFPVDTSEHLALEGVAEIFPNLTPIAENRVSMEASPFLMMAITIGFFTRESPRYFKWSMGQLKKLALKLPAVRGFLEKEKVH